MLSSLNARAATICQQESTLLGKGIHCQQVIIGLQEAVLCGNLTLNNPGTWVIVLLVWLVVALGVANLGLQVRAVLVNVALHARPVRPLRVGVNVHLDDTVADGIANVRLLRARAAMKHKEHWLGALRKALLLRDVRLSVLQDVRAQHNVPRLVHTMNIAESSGNGEKVGGNALQCLPELVYLLRLRVQKGAVNARIVNAILLSTSDAELNLKEAIDGRHALEVLDADLDVLRQGLLRQIQHVGAEQGGAVGLVVLFAGLDHAIDPWEELLGTVVCVDHHRDAIQLSQLLHLQGSGNGAGNGSLLVGVVQLLAGHEEPAAIGELDNDRRVCLLGSEQAGVNERGGGAVHSRDGIAIHLGMVEKVHKVLAVHHTGLEAKVGGGACSSLADLDGAAGGKLHGLFGGTLGPDTEHIAAGDSKLGGHATAGGGRSLERGHNLGAGNGCGGSHSAWG
mmetsp:Transcript_8558/g.24558  ORF Transcript_8558/g.24558 Transcript_8558/m.24558 type:complete len:452 (-) Transcript_8558:105-1460(-)